MYGYDFLNPDDKALLVLWWRGFTLELCITDPQDWTWGYAYSKRFFELKEISLGPFFKFYWIFSIIESLAFKNQE
jgi:hypothetical protein